jgi:hypothetical protein
MDHHDAQVDVCRRFGAALDVPATGSKAGIAPNVRSGVQPLNALRHSPSGDTCGWYIWAGAEIPQDDDSYFVPLHVEHLDVWCPVLIPYLALPAGWRVLLAPQHEDVWYDAQLLVR